MCSDQNALLVCISRFFRWQRNHTRLPLAAASLAMYALATVLPNPVDATASTARFPFRSSPRICSISSIWSSYRFIIADSLQVLGQEPGGTRLGVCRLAVPDAFGRVVVNPCRLGNHA